MKYYKVINGQNFVGIGTTLNLLKLQLAHNILINCLENEAQCFILEDQIYHADWMKAINQQDIEIIDVDIIEITEKEYQELKTIIDDNKEIPVPDNLEPEEEIIIDEDPDITLQFAKTNKIQYMSYLCQQTIYAGCDVEMDDGQSYHFTLTDHDQKLIQGLYLKVVFGQILQQEPDLYYHEDDLLCRYFTANEITKLNNAMEYTIKWNTTYFNSLKNYINHLNSIETVANIEWGIEIPKEYQSEVLQDMINENSNN